MENEIIVKERSDYYKVGIRKKLKIEEGTQLEVKVTAEGILLKPIKSIWDMLGHIRSLDS